MPELENIGEQTDEIPENNGETTQQDFTEEITEQKSSPENPARKESFFLKDSVLMILLYAVTLVLHILMTSAATIFNLTPDEYAVAAIAAYANGYDWSATVSAGGYYGYFQSLFYIPVFWFIKEPMLQYRAMLIINGIIMSLAPVIVYYLARKQFEVRKLSSVFIAIVCGTYPSYMLLTKYTWNETMCCILPWIFALLMYKSLESQKDTSHSKKAVFMQQMWAVLGGLTLIAAYATHGRMLALTAAGIVLELIVLFTMKKRLFSLIGFFSATVVGFIADKFTKDFLQSALWLTETKTRTTTNTIENMIARITKIDAEELIHFPQTLIGHFFYFFSSTWGFGAICVTIIITAICSYYAAKRREKKAAALGNDVPLPDNKKISDSLAIFCWYALLAMGAIFVVSVMFKATSTVYNTRADTAIFGRYIENFFPVAIFAALVLIYKGRLTLTQCFAGLVSASAVFVGTELVTVPAVIGDSENTKRVINAMILGIAPLRIDEGLKAPFTNSTFIKIICVVMALLLALLIARLIIHKKEKTLFNAVTLTLAALLCFTNIYCYGSYTVVQGKNAQYGANYITTALSMTKGCEYNDILSYSLKGERYTKAQFLFPDKKVRTASNITKLKKLKECPDFIITARENNLNMWIDDIYLVGSINNNVHLYACSENAINWVKEQDLPITPHGAAVYTGLEIPATSSVIRSENHAQLPQGSAVYTNYTLLPNACTVVATVKGTNVDELKIDLTSDKKANKMEYTIVSSSPNELVLRFSANKMTENVQLKLTNKTGGKDIIVESLILERENTAPIAVLPKVSGVEVRVS